MRQGLIDTVKKAAEEELKAANESFRQFASAHEGYAVILEEAQEAEVEMLKLGSELNRLWDLIKLNSEEKIVKMQAKAIEEVAQNMAAEAIQTAAMARKLLDYLESQKKEA